MSEKQSPTKRATQLRLLNELSTRLQSLLESENFYQEILNIIQLRFNYYCIQIWSVDKEQSYTLRAQAGAYNNHLKIGHTLPATQGICGAVIRTKQSYLANDVSTDPHFTNLSLPVSSKSQ